MNALTKFFIALAAIAVLAVGLLIWNTQNRTAEAKRKSADSLTTVTKEDMELLLSGLPPMQLQQIASEPDAKKKVADELRELLAVASAARKSGIAEDPANKQQLEFIRQLVLAQNYDRLKNGDKGQAPPFGYISQEDVDAFWKKPDSEARFQTFFEGFKKLQKIPDDKPMPDAQMKQLHDQWSRLILAAEMAEKDTTLPEDFKRRVDLQTKLQESQFLAQSYAQANLAEKVEATPEEIAAYLKEHPELDPVAKKAKAEEVLQRVKNGEDFAQLANEFSQDPGNKDLKDGSLKGGFYEFSASDNLDPAFKQAMISLEPGKVTENLVESQFGYHIIKLESKKTEKDKDGKDVEKYSVRHILFSTSDPNPNPMAPPMSMEDKAKAAVAEEKRKKILDTLKAENPVEVAEDFEVKVPEMPASDEMPDFSDPKNPRLNSKGKLPTAPPQGKPEPKKDAKK